MRDERICLTVVPKCVRVAVAVVLGTKPHNRDNVKEALAEIMNGGVDLPNLEQVRDEIREYLDNQCCVPWAPCNMHGNPDW